MNINNNRNNIPMPNRAILDNFVKHIHNGDYDEMKNLISIYPNILNFHHCYTYGTPLYVYLNEAENPNEEMLEFLIDRGAKLNLKIQFVGTALYCYFKKDKSIYFDGGLSHLLRENIDINIVKFLVEKGAYVDPKGRGSDLLFEYLKRGTKDDIEMVKLLISNTMQKLNFLDDYLKYAKNPNKEVIEFLIDRGESFDSIHFFYDFLNKKGDSHKEVVDFLIKADAGITYSPSRKGVFLDLYLNKFENPNKDVVKLLIENGHDLKHLGNRLGANKALGIYLKYAENPEVLKLLIENGPDFRCLADHLGINKALGIYLKCAENSNPEVLKLLTQSLVNYFGADKVLSIYLKHAENSNSEVLKLLTLDTNPNSIIDEKGNTAMHFYLERPNPSPKILKILLGIDYDTMLNDIINHTFKGKNEYNFTYDIAKIKSFLYKEKLNLKLQNNAGESFLHTYLKHAENPNLEIIKLFLCNVDIRDNDGKSPLDICRQRGVEEGIAKILIGHEKSFHIAPSSEVNDNDFINDSVDNYVIKIIGSDPEENNG